MGLTTHNHLRLLFLPRQLGYHSVGPRRIHALWSGVVADSFNGAPGRPLHGSRILVQGRHRGWLLQDFGERQGCAKARSGGPD
jgi:hypothetical protein